MFIADVLIYKRVTGSYKTADNKWIQVSEEGLPDIYGIVLTEKWPVHFEIEVKTGKDTLRPKQRTFKKCCEINNIPHCVARSVEEAWEFITNIKREVLK